MFRMMEPEEQCMRLTGRPADCPDRAAAVRLPTTASHLVSADSQTLKTHDPLNHSWA